MVAIHLNQTAHDSITGQNAPNNYGPLSVGAGYTITRISAKGGLSWTDGLLTVPFVFVNALQHGLQHGGLGYSPTSAESITAPGAEWLRFESVPPSQGAVTYVTAAANSYVSERYSFELEWRGQLYTPAGTDVYYSVGRIYNPGVNWNFHGNLVVTYS